MWNATQDPQWQQRTQSLLDATKTFFKDGPTGSVLTEVICEPQDTCKVDSSTFKAYLARWMTATAHIAPFTAAQIKGQLLASATAAATACQPGGGDGGAQCGQKWYTGEFDGKTGIGMQMNAMEVIQSLIDRPGPVDHTTGSSKGDPSTGSSDSGVSEVSGRMDISGGDKAGASILTILLGITTIGGGFWIVR